MLPLMCGAFWSRHFMLNGGDSTTWWLPELLLIFMGAITRRRRCDWLKFREPAKRQRTLPALKIGIRKYKVRAHERAVTKPRESQVGLACGTLVCGASSRLCRRLRRFLAE